MKFTVTLFSLMLFILCYTGCNKNTTDNVLLRKAETLMTAKPDSALLLLNSIAKPEKLPEKDYASWCLLYTQAQDKNNISHTTDSLIHVAMDYFEQTDCSESKMKAYYYAGIVYFDLNDAVQAQNYFLKAVEMADDVDDPLIKGRLYANLGTLYTYHDLYPQALEFQRKALPEFYQLKDSSSLAMVFRNIARIYTIQENPDSAIPFYSEALANVSSARSFSILNELTNELDSTRKTILVYRFALIGTLVLILISLIFIYTRQKKKMFLKDQVIRDKEIEYKNSIQYWLQKEKTLFRIKNNELRLKEEEKEALMKRIDSIVAMACLNKNVQDLMNNTDMDKEDAIFRDSEEYIGLCNEWEKMNKEKWPQIVEYLDCVLFIDFSHRLKSLYPSISESEMQICYLIKLDIPVKRIAQLLCVSSQSISQTRKRLYTKLTGERGGSNDLDSYIKNI